MKPNKTKRATTIAQPGGGFLHIDRYILPIKVPKPKKAKRPKRPSSLTGLEETYESKNNIEVTESAN